MVRLEFYEKDRLVTALDSAAVPNRRDFIRIQSDDFLVTGVNWCVDHSDDPALRKLRANIFLEEV